MNGIHMLMVITKREFEQDYISFLQKRNVTAVFSMLCNGTASQGILTLLGLEKTEKSLIFAIADARRSKHLLLEMISALGINMPGNGIAITIPLGSIGGASSMKYLMETQNFIIGEVADMEEKHVFPYELIAAIADRGMADMVMEAARKANAGGGTIVHAKGSGTDFTSKFFGVSIAMEKEILLIVANRKDKANIMRAIMEEAGIRSAAHTVLFSLPVEDVVGLTSVMEKEPEEE